MAFTNIAANLTVQCIINSHSQNVIVAESDHGGRNDRTSNTDEDNLDKSSDRNENNEST